MDPILINTEAQKSKPGGLGADADGLTIERQIYYTFPTCTDVVQFSHELSFDQ